MKRIATTLGLALWVTACGSSNPFTPVDTEVEPPAEETPTETPTETPIESRGLPPGTASPTPTTSINRYEEVNEIGGGYAKNIVYTNVGGVDSFYVDNLAFDGDNSYVRGNAVSSLGPYAVYESDLTTTDPLTGKVINTLPYRAIYGKSNTGETEFAIVRTGSYRSYGFGGFVYQRNQTDNAGNDVSLVMPTSGDAEYSGAYAATRIFDGRGGLEYVTGNATMVVDFKDFNEAKNGVYLYVRDRKLYDASGTDITASYLTAIETANTGKTVVHETDSAGNEVLPRLSPLISPDIADANGEMVGGMHSVVQFNDGSAVALDEGNFYAIMSGQNAQEVVGVIVVEQDDPRVDNVTSQETGGFIVYRQ